MSERETPPPKKDVARALLLRGSVFVYLDPRASGVAVPSSFAGQPQLVLQVGLDMPVPIPDLRVDDEGVYATLSFNRTPFTCAVPWSAVYAMVGDDGLGMVWHDDLPEEIALDVERGLGRATAAPRPGPKLRAIEGGASSAEPSIDEDASAPTDAPPGTEDGDDEPPPSPSRPTHLRLVK